MLWRARLWAVVLLALPACIFGPVMLGFGAAAGLVVLGQAVVATAVGSGLFYLAKQFVSPTLRNCLM